MSIMDENNGMVMPVQPMYGNGGYGNGLGFGGDATWLIILFLFLIGGWGNGNGFGGNMGGIGSLPYYFNNTDNAVRSGFDQAATAGTLAGIQTSINNGFANAEIAACGRATDSLVAGYTNQIASMNQNFSNQLNLQSNLNDLAMGLQNCCCENRASIADLKYTVATENCADRAAVSDALRDVIAANTASTQRILDQLCQDKIDAKNDTIAQLRQELMFARGQASQEAQTAVLRAGQVAEVDALYDRLNSCPVSTVPVYGKTPIFGCSGSTGCGCGM